MGDFVDNLGSLTERVFGGLTAYEQAKAANNAAKGQNAQGKQAVVDDPDTKPAAPAWYQNKALLIGGGIAAAALALILIRKR